MTREKDEWDAFNEGVKVGDKLVSTPTWGVGAVTEVRRITATMLVCRPQGRDTETRVSRRDGFVLGQKGYSRTLFRPATAARLRAHRAAVVKEWCRHQAQTQLSALTPEQQDAVYKLVESFTKEEITQ